MSWKALAIRESLKHNDIAVTDRLARALLGIDGGPGSGNFGHAGRPGEVGGSAPDDGVLGLSAVSSPEKIKKALESRTANIDSARKRVDSSMQFNFFSHYLNGVMYGQGKGHDAIYAYNWHGDVLINNLLRNGDPKSYEQQDEWVNGEEKTREHIEALTEVMEKNKLRQPAVVFRGIETKDGLAKTLGIDVDAGGMDELLNNPEFAEGLIGQTFSDPAFVSTSIDPEVPIRCGFAKACEMEIYCPEGTEGVYLGDQARIVDEHEYIMQRGTQFVVTDAEVAENRFGVKSLKLKAAVVEQQPKEIPDSYKKPFREPREEIRSAVKGEDIDTKRLKELYPKATESFLEKVNYIRKHERTIESDEELWSHVEAQLEIGTIDPTEAAELESYGMHLDRFKDSDSYRRQLKEIREEEEKMKSSEFDSLREQVKKDYPYVPDSAIPLLMIYRDDATRTNESYKHDVERYGESYITQKKKKRVKRILEQEKTIANQLRG